MKFELRKTLAIVILFCSLSIIVWGLMWMQFSFIVNESQIVENLQAIFLMIGFIAHFYSYFRSDSDNYCILFVGLSIFYLTFCVRELELDESQTWIAFVTNPPVRNYWLIAAWAVSLLVFLRNMKSTFGSFLEWINNIHGLYLIFGGFFYVSADLFDKNVFSIRQDINLFIEEILEFNATIFMVLSAVLSLAWARKQVWWNSARHAFR